MPPIDYAKLLRENVKARVNAKRGVQAGLARAMGIEDPAVSKWLNGEHNPGMDKLGAIAAFFKCSLADLFSPVKESIAGAYPVMASGPQSSSNPSPGDADDSAAQDRLQEQLAILAKENAALRLALDGIADELKTLAAVVRPRKAKGEKPDARGRR